MTYRICDLLPCLMAGLLATALLLGAASAAANPRDQARRLHDRIAGVPPDTATLDAMAADIAAGDPDAAAFTAMQHPGFHDVVLKNLAMPWSNEEQTAFAPLNDYVATVVGLVRDDEDFRKVLYADLLYVADPALGLPAYRIDSNAHYSALEASGVSLRDALVPVAQSQLTGLSPDAVAGVLTSRAASQAFFKDGTNRAMLRFTLMNHLCRDLEQVKDLTRTPDRIRQDVSRSPGGDSRLFLNGCIGCHSGMDPLAQAFAYHEWLYDGDSDPDGVDGLLDWSAPGESDPDTGTRVRRKYHINATTFPGGYVTPDDGWENYWRAGANAALGWDPALPGSGNGAASLGQELAHSSAFAQCHVEQVFRTVCLRSPEDAADRQLVADTTAAFQAGGHRLKPVFAATATWCMGD